VIWSEGEASAFDSSTDPNVAKALFDLADLAKLTENWRLADARSGSDNYKKAGR